VPAAYGPIDAAVGHYRRYSKAALRRALQAVGLSIERLRYTNFVGLLGWMYNARVGRIEKQSDAQIRIFNDFVVPWYSVLERVVVPPVGLSLLAIASRAR
jgi:hypothetical protein